MPCHHHFEELTSTEPIGLFGHLLDEVLRDSFHPDQLLACVDAARELPEELGLLKSSDRRLAKLDQVVEQDVFPLFLIGLVEVDDFVNSVVDGVV